MVEREEELIAIMLELKNNVKALNDKKGGVNIGAIITSVIASIIVGSFLTYIAYIKFEVATTSRLNTLERTKLHNMERDIDHNFKIINGKHPDFIFITLEGKTEEK